MITDSKCPDRAILEEFACGQLPQDQREGLAGHIQSCSECQKRLRTLDSSVEATEAPVSRQDVTRGLFAAEAEGLDENLVGLLAPAQRPDEIGRLGGYCVLKVLGSGGMGAVFLAHDLHLERQVALKVMKPVVAANPRAKQRFIREAKACAALKNDHIITIHQVGEDRGIPFFAMEFLEGMPLDRFLLDNQRLGWLAILKIGREVAQGLAAAHAKGLIHRDIKPGNLWLEGEPADIHNERFRVKILDFGLARGRADDVQLTQEGAIVGTPAYMAPEQAQAEAVDARADLFSLGCVLYRLCSGELPFRGETAMGVLMSVTTQTPKALRQSVPGIPAALAELIEQLLAKDPGQRPASARVVVEMIQTIERQLTAVSSRPSVEATAIMEELSVPVTKPATTPVPDRQRSSRGWLAAVAAVVLLSVLSLAGWVIIRDREGKEVARVPIPEGGRVEVRPDGKPPDVPAKQLPAAANPFDALERKDIPEYELAQAGLGKPRKAPATLVAILGDSSLRHLYPVQAVVFSPDGGKIASVGADMVLRLWDATTGQQLFSLPVVGYHQPGLTGRHNLAFSPDGKRIVVLHPGPGARGPRIHDVTTGKEVLSLASEAPVLAVAYNRAGTRLAGGDEMGRVHVWEANTGKKVYDAEGHESAILAIAFQPDGTRLATAGKNGLIKVWDPSMGKLVNDLKGHTAMVPTLAFNPDGSRLASGAMDDTVRLWDTRNWENVATIKGFEYGARCLTFTPDGSHLVGAMGGTIKAYDVKSGDEDKEHSPARTMRKPSSFDPGAYFRFNATCLALDAAGKRLVTGGEDHAVRVWDAATGVELPIGAVNSAPTSVEVSRDGSRIAVGAADGVVVWDVAGRRVLHKLTDLPYGVNAVRWSPDGKYLAAGNMFNAACLWDAQSGKKLHMFPGDHNPVHDLAFSPDSQLLAIGRAFKFTEVIQTATGHQAKILEGFNVDCLAFGPDKRLVMMVRDGRLLKANPLTGDIDWSVPLKVLARALWVTPNGEVVVQSTPGRTFDGKTGAEIRSAGIFPWAVSMDGKQVFGSGVSGRGVYDLATGKLVDPAVPFPYDFPANPLPCAFAPDGRHVVIAAGNTTLHVYRLAPGPKE